MLRLLIFALPIGMAVAASALTVPLVPVPRWSGIAGRWVVGAAISTVVLLATDRLTRRLLPLAVLLRLSLAFPDQAPSRLKLARTAASVRDLREVAERARRNQMFDEPARAAEQILTLVAAVEGHDRTTRGHSERVRLYTELVAEEVRLSSRERDRLRWAALLHDVGKLTVPYEVLNKKGALDDDEWTLVRRHPEEGERLIRPLAEWLGEWAAVVREHHERYDGAGYPDGLDGRTLSRGARIVSVADAYDTMTARRPYKRPMRPAQARKELVAHAGGQFDPAIVRAFLQISVGRLRLAAGPLSWLAQTPLLRGIEQVAGTGGVAAGAAAMGGALIIGLAPVTPPATPDRPPAATQPSQQGDDVLQQLVASPSPTPEPGPSGTEPAPVPTEDERIPRSPEPSPTKSESPDPTDVPTRQPSPSPSPSPEPSPTPPLILPSGIPTDIF